MFVARESDVTDVRFLSLYREAFPPDEQIPPLKLRRLRGRGGRLLSFEDGGEYIGFVFTYERKDILYIAYIAVMPEKRNLGYGSDFLEYILSERKHRAVFLTAEAATGKGEDLKQRTRRVRFYRRNGWERTGTVLLTYGVNLEVYAADGEPDYEDVSDVLNAFYDAADGRFTA